MNYIIRYIFIFTKYIFIETVLQILFKCSIFFYENAQIQFCLGGRRSFITSSKFKTKFLHRFLRGTATLERSSFNIRGAYLKISPLF